MTSDTRCRDVRPDGSALVVSEAAEDADPAAGTSAGRDAPRQPPVTSRIDAETITTSSTITTVIIIIPAFPSYRGDRYDDHPALMKPPLRRKKQPNPAKVRRKEEARCTEHGVGCTGASGSRGRGRVCWISAL